MTAQQTQIGDLDRRLVLQAPDESDDGAGGIARSYTPVTTLWAQVMPLSGRADVAADNPGAALRYRRVLGPGIAQLWGFAAATLGGMLAFVNLVKFNADGTLGLADISFGVVLAVIAALVLLASTASEASAE